MLGHSRFVKPLQALEVRDYPLEHDAASLVHEPFTGPDLGADRGHFASFAHRGLPRALVGCSEPPSEPAEVLLEVASGRASVAIHD